MTEIFAQTFRNVSEGDTVEIPSDSTTGFYRVGQAEFGPPRPVVTVVGTGELSEHVVLRHDADGWVNVPESHILGIDAWTETVWYAVPTEAYE